MMVASWGVIRFDKLGFVVRYIANGYAECVVLAEGDYPNKPVCVATVAARRHNDSDFWVPGSPIPDWLPHKMFQEVVKYHDG